MAGLIRSIVSGVCGLAGLCAAGGAVAADAIPGEQYCDSHPISSISFSGNRVTRAQVMLRESAQAIDAPCSLDDIIDTIQNIMDLGLFRSVRAEMQLINDALDVQFIVREKFFFLAVPRFSRTTDGELRAGLQLRWDNFAGRLHELKITSEKRQEDNGQGRSGFVHSIGYNVPRFLGNNFGLAFSARSARRQVEFSQDAVIYGEGIRVGSQFEVQLSRWVNRSNGVQGLKFYGGVRVEHRDFEIHDGDAGPFTEGSDISLLFGVENRKLHVESYRRRGWVYGGGLRIASPATGSDFHYHRADAYFRWYHPLSSGLRNLNVHARLGISDGAPFGERAYDIGGGDVLRGMPPGSRSGDVMTLLNVEYLSSFFTWPDWRWVLFVDAGNTYLKDAVKPLRQFVRPGIGLRWKIEALTNTDLRVDVAWDAEARRARAYVATRLTF